MLLTHLVSTLLALSLFSTIHASESTSGLKCQEDDDDCREALMHPDLQEDTARRISHLQESSTEYWLDMGQRFVAYKEASANLPIRGKARNIIIFVGDGMSLTTLAGTRVYMGGEEKSLSFESFPDTGLLKTYAIDRLVPDSASTATALLCGVKTNYGTLGVTGRVKRGDCEASKNKALYVNSIAQYALDSGRDVGVVTTTRVTHATPAALYAHSADRNWENDKKVNKDCGKKSGIKDIAWQLMEGKVGSRLKVIMGGGKTQFLDETFYEGGKRRDGRNLIEEFLSADPLNSYVETKDELLALDKSRTNRLLGLFADSHMEYHLKTEGSNQPSLSEMTQKAIELLEGNENGYLLFVEAGRIDTAHHENKAKLALDETSRLSEAVALARSMTNTEDTLVVVTSDHSHTMSIAGYTQRGNDIFDAASVADDGFPYLSLSYANGPSYKRFYNTKKFKRYDPLTRQGDSPTDIQFPSTVPMSSETHGGEDVPVYASGPWSDLFSGVYEQSYLPHLVGYAGCFGPGKRTC